MICVETKRGLDRHAAILKSPEVTQRELRDAAKEATRATSRFRAYRFGSPVELEIDFLAVTAATASSFIPGVERVGPRSIVYRHDDYRTVYHMSWIFQLIAQGNYVHQDRL